MATILSDVTGLTIRSQHIPIEQIRSFSEDVVPMLEWFDATLLRSLLTAGLVDEMRLFLHPVVLGSGERLFDNSQRRIALTLAESHAYDNGVVALNYQPTKR